MIHHFSVDQVGQRKKHMKRQLGERLSSDLRLSLESNSATGVYSAVVIEHILQVRPWVRFVRYKDGWGTVIIYRIWGMSVNTWLSTPLWGYLTGWWRSSRGKVSKQPGIYWELMKNLFCSRQLWTETTICLAFVKPNPACPGECCTWGILVVSSRRCRGWSGRDFRGQAGLVCLGMKVPGLGRLWCSDQASGGVQPPHSWGFLSLGVRSAPPDKVGNRGDLVLAEYVQRSMRVPALFLKMSSGKGAWSLIGCSCCLPPFILEDL